MMSSEHFNIEYLNVPQMQQNAHTESLKISVTANDLRRSASYCGDLVLENLLTGDMKSEYKYLQDLVHYSKGDVKVEAQELSGQIKMRMEMGVTEIPDELIKKTEFIVHKVSPGFRISYLVHLVYKLPKKAPINTSPYPHSIPVINLTGLLLSLLKIAWCRPSIIKGITKTTDQRTGNKIPSNLIMIASIPPVKAPKHLEQRKFSRPKK